MSRPPVWIICVRIWIAVGVSLSTLKVTVHVVNLFSLVECVSYLTILCRMIPCAQLTDLRLNRIHLHLSHLFLHGCNLCFERCHFIYVNHSSSFLQIIRS